MQTPSLLERLQTALGGAYTIERELGGGGMARVFVAEERALGRKVVVKVLVPVVGEELNAERFAREIRLAAALQQANIVPLLTAGDAEGIPYYTMPYVAGQSLRGRLHGEVVPLPEAMSILRDVARALAFAHAHGVVHRDVKPENILLSGGTAVVTDFGIAKAVDRARSGSVTDSTLTRDGTSVGTPAYMSPEQCAGDPDVDHRSDIYAWGVVAYELLVGHHPFSGCQSTHELITAHFVRVPEPIVERRRDCPAPLAALVERCLAKEARQRPSSAEELMRALDGVVATRTASATAIPGAVAVSAGMPSVAVLPLTNLSGTADDEYFADGMSEEIMSALAHVRGIRVAARTSSFAFKGQRVDLREVAEKLGVATVLEGSVRRAAVRVRVNTQLVSAADGLHLWSGRFDREMSDIFAVQDEIARSIAGTLDETLRGTALREVVPRRAAGPANVEAYEQYLRGRQHLDQRSTDVAAALACFERAATLDPSLSVAHAGLAHVFTWLGLWYVAPAGYAFAKAREAADRALALDPNDAVALSALAIVSLWHDWNWAEARRLAERAVEVSPGLPLGYSVMTYVCITGNDDAGAIAAAERSVLLDPLSNAAKTDLADALQFAGRYQHAVDVLTPVNVREPSHTLANLWRAHALDSLGDAAGAVTYAERAVADSGRSPALVATLAQFLARAGRPDEARALAAELETRAAQQHIAPFLLGVATADLGDRDVTLAHLERAVAARDPHVAFMHRERYWDALRGDPRFEALIAAVGLRVGRHPGESRDPVSLGGALVTDAGPRLSPG